MARDNTSSRKGAGMEITRYTSEDMKERRTLEINTNHWFLPTSRS